MVAFLLGLTFWVAALFILAAVTFYFLPTLIASLRGHSSFSSIFLVNLFLGWTAIGWFLTLVWALVPSRRLETIRVPRDEDMISVN